MYLCRGNVNSRVIIYILSSARPLAKLSALRRALWVDLEKIEINAPIKCNILIIIIMIIIMWAVSLTCPTLLPSYKKKNA